MVRFVRAFFGIVPFALLSAPSCSDEEASCCYEGIGDYCERNECQPFQEMFADPCRNRDVFYEEGSNRLAIGLLHDLGGWVYFFRGTKVVGVVTYNDVVEPCGCLCGHRAECSNIKEVGELFFTAADKFSGCADCDGLTCSDCGGLTHCTLCPDFFAEGEAPPPCPVTLGHAPAQ